MNILKSNPLQKIYNDFIQHIIDAGALTFVLCRLSFYITNTKLLLLNFTPVAEGFGQNIHAALGIRTVQTGSHFQHSKLAAKTHCSQGLYHV